MTTMFGLPACSCHTQWIPAFQAELKRQKVSSIRFTRLIYRGGGTSGDTHWPGGGGDGILANVADYAKAVKIARNMGAAAWHRTPAQGFIHHLHFVLVGCPHNSGGRYQIAALNAGYNGLGYQGRQGRDDGPRSGVQLPLRTFKQGIAWAKTQARPATKTRTTTFEAATFNVKGGTSGFLSRVPIIRARVMKALPHFLLVQELPTSSRLLISAALASKYRIGYYGHNKAQYVIRNRQGWVKVKGAAYSIGNGRHAVVVRYRHRHTGADMVIATPHPSWEHSAARNRTEEANELVRILRRDFKGIPHLIGGDTNDSDKAISDRKHDSFGDALKAAGFHDLYNDVTGAKRHGEQYNTAHQYKTPIPRSGIHIDRFFGTSEFEGIEWTNDAHSGKRGADHWLVNMRISLRHPSK